MIYAETYIGQRVVVVHHRYYSDRNIGRSGTITKRYDGISTEHGTVEVKLDGEFYLPPSPNYCEYTHMGVDQLAPA